MIIMIIILLSSPDNDDDDDVKRVLSLLLMMLTNLRFVFFPDFQTLNCLFVCLFIFFVASGFFLPLAISDDDDDYYPSILMEHMPLIFFLCVCVCVCISRLSL